jgi:hypothetical protein
MFRRKHTYLLFIILMPVALLAQQCIVIDSLHEQIGIPDSSTHMLIDEAEELLLEHAIEQHSAFLPIDDEHEFESNIAYWFRFEIESRLQSPSEWMLYVGQLGFADVYIQEEDGSFIHRRAGKYVPFSERDVTEGRSHKVRLKMPPGVAKSIYVRLKEIDHKGFYPRFHLAEMSYWKSLSDEIEHVIVAAFCGVLFIIMLYNFILFVVTRQSAHLYYGPISARQRSLCALCDEYFCTDSNRIPTLLHLPWACLLRIYQHIVFSVWAGFCRHTQNYSQVG